MVLSDKLKFKLPPEFDRRKKFISDKILGKIRNEYRLEVTSYKKLAHKYKLSISTIYRIINPEFREICNEKEREKQRHKFRYNKEEHRKTMQKTRQHRAEVLEYKVKPLRQMTPHLITYKGETKNIREWATILNINYGTLQSRIFRGMTIRKAFTLKDKTLNLYSKSIYF